MEICSNGVFCNVRYITLTEHSHHEKTKNLNENEKKNRKRCNILFLQTL